MSKDSNVIANNRVANDKIYSDTDSATAPISDADDHHLNQLGYKPQLHRGLSPILNLAFGFTEVAILSSICTTFTFAIGAGGPAEIIWCYMVEFFMTILISYCMAELCGAYPSAGSVYHWAAQLAPREHAPLWSYACGWFNFAGNAAGDASFASGFASLVAAGAYITTGANVTTGQQVGISIGCLIIQTVLNFFRIDQVGWINGLAAVAHICAIIIVFVALLTLTPQLGSGSFVFTEFFNNTGFCSN